MDNHQTYLVISLLAIVGLIISLAIHIHEYWMYRFKANRYRQSLITQAVAEAVRGNVEAGEHLVDRINEIESKQWIWQITKNRLRKEHKSRTNEK